jgi:6-phosphofructokinase 1
MNAAIPAVVRSGLVRSWEVCGVRSGFAGLIAGEMQSLGARDVGGIIQCGGTMLGSARCLEFRTDEGRQLALDALERRGIEGLVVIGGNGSQQGAQSLSRLGLPVVGVGSTIDNDLYGADITIGVDTALNIALEAIDRLKVTASSHQRAFVVEVMGRDCGYLALTAAIAGGAEAVAIPEIQAQPECIARAVRDAYMRGKTHAIVVVSEHALNGCGAEGLRRYFVEHSERLGFDLRVTQLGHVQRGGTPGAFDRLLGSRAGAAAVDCLARGEHGVLVGLRGERMEATPLAEVVSRSKPLDPELLELVRTLAT